MHSSPELHYIFLKNLKCIIKLNQFLIKLHSNNFQKKFVSIFNLRNQSKIKGFFKAKKVGFHSGKQNFFYLKYQINIYLIQFCDKLSTYMKYKFLKSDHIYRTINRTVGVNDLK